MGDKTNSNYRPKFYELLSAEDKAQYDKMHYGFSVSCRNLRGKRVETFGEILNTIRQFCIRGDANDSIRCLVCGICWISNGIAINTRQLCILLKKCKSSINGSLQKLGYSTLQNRSEASNALTEAIPMLKDNFNELREWSVRLFVAATPQPNFSQFNYANQIPYTPSITRTYPSVQNFSNMNVSNSNSNQLQPFLTPAPSSYSVQTSAPKPNQENESKTSENSSEPLDSDSFSITDSYFDDPFCCVPSFLNDNDENDPTNPPDDSFSQL